MVTSYIEKYVKYALFIKTIKLGFLFLDILYHLFNGIIWFVFYGPELNELVL